MELLKQTDLMNIIDYEKVREKYRKDIIDYKKERRLSLGPVSYTHLTLPTILLV